MDDASGDAFRKMAHRKQLKEGLKAYNAHCKSCADPTEDSENHELAVQRLSETRVRGQFKPFLIHKPVAFHVEPASAETSVAAEFGISEFISSIARFIPLIMSFYHEPLHLNIQERIWAQGKNYTIRTMANKSRMTRTLRNRTRWYLPDLRGRQSCRQHDHHLSSP